jgi:hypothetical protein
LQRNIEPPLSIRKAEVKKNLQILPRRFTSSVKNLLNDWLRAV